jgi:hypothetical protein
MSKFKTAYNSKHADYPGESFVGRKSMTQPDSALSIKELIARYASGRPLSGSREPEYDVELDGEIVEMVPGFAKMDNLERIDALRNVQKEMKSISDNVARLGNYADKRKAKALKKQLKKLEEPKPTPPPQGDKPVV